MNLVHKERKNIRTFLKEENLIHEHDLIEEYTLFTVCNWGESLLKNHFLSVRRVFGVEYIEQLLAKNVLLDNLVKVQLSRGSSGGNRVGKGSGLPSVPTLRRSSSRHTPEKATRGSSHSQQLASSPRYLMHLFNFWQEAYTYRVVSLDEDQGSSNEVAFLHVPRHSAHIYAVSLTTDPTLPKYVGSNLHFTSGREVQRCFMSAPTAVAEATLRAAVFEHMMAMREEAPGGPAYSAASWQGEMEEGGGNDFAFGFGFGDNDAGTLGDNNTYSSSHRQGVADTPSRSLPLASTPSSCVLPVVRSMVISFEPGALKDLSWGGCVWVYLPVNGLNPAMAEWNLGKIHITGSAWRDSSNGSGAFDRGFYADAALQEATSAEEHSSESSALLHTISAGVPNSRSSVSSELMRDMQAQGAHLVTRVVAPECRIAGSVFRIAVSCSSSTTGKTTTGHNSRETSGHPPGAYSRETSGHPPGAQPAPSADAMFFQDEPAFSSSSSSNRYSHDAGERYNHTASNISSSNSDDTVTAQLDGAEYIIVSWIYDVKDAASSSLAR